MNLTGTAKLDGNVSSIQKDFNVTVVSRDGGIKIIGDGDTDGAEKALRALMILNT